MWLDYDHLSYFLVGRELIFFMLAGIVLCFEFRIRIMLVTDGCLVVAEQCLH